MCPGRLQSDCRSDHKVAKIGSNNVQRYYLKNPQQLQEASIPNTSSFCPVAQLWHYVLYTLHSTPKLSPTGSFQQHGAVFKRSRRSGSLLEAHLTEQLRPLTFKTGGTEIVIFSCPAAEQARRAAVAYLWHCTRREEAWFSALILKVVSSPLINLAFKR